MMCIWEEFYARQSEKIRSDIQSVKKNEKVFARNKNSFNKSTVWKKLRTATTNKPYILQHSIPFQTDTQNVDYANAVIQCNIFSFRKFLSIFAFHTDTSGFFFR